MKIRSMLLLSVALFALVPFAVVAQAITPSSEIPEPDPADFRIAVPVIPPIVTDSPARPSHGFHVLSFHGREMVVAASDLKYFEAVKALSEKRDQFVHCKLTSGKILTGQLRSVGATSFEVQTDALGEYHVIRYNQLADAPVATPAVGTRVKQGFEWAGFIVLIIVLLPILPAFMPDC
jgi:hypothetical protein